MRGSTVLLSVFSGLFLAGCAGQAPPQVPASNTSSSSATSATSTMVTSPGTSTPINPAPPTTTPSRALEPGMTVRGTVSAGVEAGCLILGTSTAQYLLLGADPAIAVAGAEIEVTGKAEPGMMTTCQQGTPFAVQKTLRINP